MFSSLYPTVDCVLSWKTSKIVLIQKKKELNVNWWDWMHDDFSVYFGFYSRIFFSTNVYLSQFHIVGQHIEILKEYFTICHNSSGIPNVLWFILQIFHGSLHRCCCHWKFWIASSSIVMIGDLMRWLNGMMSFASPYHNYSYLAYNATNNNIQRLINIRWKWICLFLIHIRNVLFDNESGLWCNCDSIKKVCL